MIQKVNLILVLFLGLQSVPCFAQGPHTGPLTQQMNGFQRWVVNVWATLKAWVSNWDYYGEKIKEYLKKISGNARDLISDLMFFFKAAWERLIDLAIGIFERFNNLFKS